MCDLGRACDRQGINYKFWHLTCDLDLIHRVMGFVCNTFIPSIMNIYKLQNMDTWYLGVTLTFDIESCVSYTTRLHIRVNIFIKYHEDTTNTCEVMALTWYKLHNFDLCPLSVTLTFEIVMGLVRDTSTHHA